MNPEQLSDEYFRATLRSGFRVIGEFLGVGHTVGLVLDETDNFHFVGLELAKRRGEVEHGTIPVADLQYFIQNVQNEGGWIRVLPPEVDK